MKDERLYLIHIVECVTRIQQHTSEGKDVFMSDTKTQDAVLRNLQILAESTQRISRNLKAAHPEVEWSKIAGLRNILVHDYLGINLVRVWEILQHGLPELKNQVASILKALGEP
ncbi:MAG: DUF86 domain-containing protein [Terriglobia bacterium]